MAPAMDKLASPLLPLKNELLLSAVVRGELPTARRLLDRHGADVNSENNSKMSTLQLAIVNRHSKLAEYLIQKGVDIHKVDSNGWSALHDAALLDNFVIVRKLISKGLSPMLTTNQGELVIDVAGSHQMERLLCEEMCIKGEVALARQYYRYLGLNLIAKPPGAHNSFSKGNRGNLCSSMTPGKDIPHYGSKEVVCLRTKDTCSVNDNTSGACKLSASVGRPGEAMMFQFYPNTAGSSTHIPSASQPPVINCQSPHSSSQEVVYNTADSSGSRDPNKNRKAQVISLTSATQALQQPQCFDSDKGEPVIKGHHLTTNESAQPNYPKSSNQREESVINSLYKHSVFQLQIGLSLLNKDSQSTSLDQDPSTEPEYPSSFDSNNSLTYPLARHHHRKATRTQSDPVSQDPLQVHFQNPRSTRKVSFSSSPMTKSKTTSLGSPESRKSSTYSNSKRSTIMEDCELSATDVLTQLTKIYEQQNSEEAEVEDAGMRALRLRPRKSSIASPQRRRSYNSRRRSVSFQPEVLLHESVISGDAKAVSDVLQSGKLEDVNGINPAGLTALHQSAIDGNLDCAKTLVENGAHVNCTDCESWTPLHAAAVTGNIEFVRFLLLSGADSTLKNDDAETAYDIAKDNQVRKMLLHSMNGKSPDSNDFSDVEYSGEEEEEYSHAESDSEDESEASELFGLAKDRKPSLKERLGLKHSSALRNVRDVSVSPSPDLESSDSVFVNGQKSPELSSKHDQDHNDSMSSCSSIQETELDKAQEKTDLKPTANSDTEKISEDQGFSTMEGSTSDCSHRSRIMSEDEGNTRDVLDSELVPGSLDYRFQEACLYCDVDSILKLLKHKKDINVNRVNITSGITALHHSVLEENYALVQHLIADFDASVHIQDTDGWTPLHAASAVGNIRIAQLLLENGAKASILNTSCEFPVDVASDKAMEKLLKNVMLGPGVGTLFQGVLTR